MSESESFAIVEKSRRRPEFLEDSIAVTLADGQDWFFPRPRIRFVRSRTELGFETRSGFGKEFDGLVSRLRDSGQSFADMIAAQLEIAEFLLMCNYNLTLEEFQDLVQFVYESDVEDVARDAIMGIALGLSGSPKVSTAGETSA